MRLYHIDAVCVAADCDRRWVDNLLSRFAIDGVEAGGRGRARRISLRALRQVAIVRELAVRLGVPLVEAVRISAGLLTHGPPVAVGAGLAVQLDQGVIDRLIEERLALAAESLAPKPRGRPSARRRSS